LERNGTLYDPQVRALKAGACHVTMTGQEPLNLTVLHRDPQAALIECDGIREDVALLSQAATPALRFGGRSFDFRDLSFAPTVRAGAQGDGRVRATMNGSVVSVDVAVGDRVEAGQKVLVLEAMKMEHTHTSAVAGTVSAVHIEAGSQVTAHSVVVEITPVAAPA
jgi:geranyl-CoA carboxylase alpha subunit